MLMVWISSRVARGCIAVLLLIGAVSQTRANWPQWRGPQGTGVASNSADPPVEWHEGKNIRWKTPITGLGHSTPVVWGNHLYFTSAVPVGEKLSPRYSDAPGAHDNLPVEHRFEFWAFCVARDSGAVSWKIRLNSALPHDGGHNTASLASASPVTDGNYVIVSFGSYGIYGLDLEGNLVWHKDLGRMQTKHGHGEGSSPALYGDLVLVTWDHEGQSFLLALDKSTGEERWKLARNEVTSWSSPLIVDVAGRAQAIVPGTTRLRGYDLSNGDVIWECAGLSSNIVASPVASEGMVYVGSSYDTKNMLAIRLIGAKGDITGTKHVVWNRRDRTPYVPSPLLYGEQLYFLSHYQGVLTRVTAKTGEEEVGPFRLGGIRNVYASPVGAANRVYITSLEGVTQVISHGGIPRTLAINRLDDSFSASAVIVDKEIYLRGRESLYCIAREDP